MRKFSIISMFIFHDWRMLRKKWITSHLMPSNIDNSFGFVLDTSSTRLKIKGFAHTVQLLHVAFM